MRLIPASAGIIEIGVLKAKIRVVTDDSGLTRLCFRRKNKGIHFKNRYKTRQKSFHNFD